MPDTTLHTKIKSLPKNLQSEASDFIDFLLEKKRKKKNGAKRKAGFLKGKIKMNDDFDEPLEDFKEYM